jgi:hypothetical protein
MVTINLTEAEAEEIKFVLRIAEIDYRHAANRLLDDDATTNGIRFVKHMLFDRGL